ncbi:MAG: T9SS type A sorting domain-containing protein [Saprospiraceae bacterium]|nr:T9SS type A sorting domain-containing protein [Saprospiraceae bacterium]
MHFKGLLTLIALMGIVISSFAQERGARIQDSKIYQNPQNRHARDMDVVFYPTVDDDCSLSVTVFTITERWGYVTGTNEYGDKEKAQLLEFSGSATYQILGVAAYFVESGIVDDGNLFAKIYSVGANGAPEDLIGTSEPVKVSEVISPTDTTVEITGFIFDSLPDMNMSQFFASIDFSALYDSKDTAALFQTMLGCGDGSNTYEKWIDDEWVSFDSAWGTATSPFDIDLLLGAIVEFDGSTTADEYINHRGLQLFPATPNPASYHTLLNYGLEKAQPVEIIIFDAQGKHLKTINHEIQNAGRHQEEIYTHNFAPGQYYYQIATRTGRLISRFVVQR